MEEFLEARNRIDATRGRTPDIKKIVLAAHQAPTGDNWQPWSFIWKEDRLTMLADLEKTHSFLDHNAGLVWVSLGCALANMAVAAQEDGFEMDLILFPKTKGQNPVAEITFFPLRQKGHPLFKFLGKRCTNRCPYWTWPLSKKLRNDFQTLAESLPGAFADFLFHPRQISKIARTAARFESVYFRNKAVHDDLFRWLRLSRSEEENKKDGIPLGATEVNFFEKLAIRFMSSWTGAKVLGFFGGELIMSLRAWNLYRQSGAFGLICIDGSGPEDFVKAGLLLERIWLAATRLGLSLQPIAGPAFLSIRKRWMRGKGLSEKEMKTAEKIDQEAGRLLPNFRKKTPVIFFRLGYASPPTARSLRRPVESLLKEESYEDQNRSANETNRV